MVTLPMRTAPSRPPARGSKNRGGRIGTAIFLVVVLGGLFGAWAWWNGTVGSVPIREHCTAVAAGTSAEFDPDQAGNAAIIAAVAVRRNLPARAATIGIATSVQESKLRNIEYGDRDSLGLFQQRPSQGWGSKKQVLDPVYASGKFFDALVKIKGYESMEITQVAQKVQRSAYPEAYADHEPEGRVLASALSGYSPGGFNCVLRGTPDDLPAESVTTGAPTPRANAVAEAAAYETGRKAVGAAGVEGRGVQFAVSPKENNRYGWSLAHWAVARANSLHIVAVQVGDKRWTRDDSTDGWTSADKPIAAGKVVVEVA